MYYSELNTRIKKTHVEGYGEVEPGSIGLYRFQTKTERDSFVADTENASVIKAKDAQKRHKELFRYWESKNET